MFVLTVDQRRSRRDVDRVPELLRDLSAARVVRPFDRTAGDEVQAVLDDPEQVVTLALDLVRREHWSVGIGTGPVELPLPAVTRAGRGPAFEHARTAVERAKSAVTHLAVDGPDASAAEAAATVLDLVALLVQRRSPEGWAAVELISTGHTQSSAAAVLGVSKQAVSQRLRATAWQQEEAGRTLAASLLAEADR
ncbi:hypothetical protein [Rhodococcus sp. X156]|uniref:hypothetical protein n=1 Tax=Rhodococcus sp. X156 TaxID=2499145 RepID=UPI000FDA8618|nr:hypothetical protein [Rhodococcus sp. X156]